MKFLIFILAFPILFLQAQTKMELEGSYQGDNVYLRNPITDIGFCIDSVTLNGERLQVDLNNNAIELKLDESGLALNDQVKLVIYHQSDCLPSTINKNMSDPKTSYMEDQTPENSEDTEPEFPGGQAAMQKFIVKHIEYPQIAIENGVSGRVFVQFVVSKDGSISDVQVVRGISPELDAEAVRVIKLMPKWTPGTQGGNPVNIRFTLPINFRLN
ncbi:MAG: energy transducer TonB [Flavobacteriales bacterium]|nr:energy transducer TonB [Flavobacteriales bacterium]